MHWQCFQGVTFPRQPLPVINPSFPPILASVKEDTKTWKFFISGCFLARSAQADIRKLYIKVNNKAYSWHNRIKFSPKRVWSRGHQVPDEGLCCLRPEPAQSSWRIFQGCILTNLLVMTKARQGAAFQRSSWHKHLFCKNTRLLIIRQTGTHLITFHFYFLTWILTNDTKPCYFIAKNVWLF